MSVFTPGGERGQDLLLNEKKRRKKQVAKQCIVCFHFCETVTLFNLERYRFLSAPPAEEKLWANTHQACEEGYLQKWGQARGSGGLSVMA